MKIAIDVRCLMQKNYSGVSFYTLNLLKALFNIDHENEYLLFYNSSRPVTLPVFDFSNVRYVGFKYPNKLFNLCLALFSWPKLDKLIGGADIFFVPNLNFLALSGDCRTIVTVHDLSFLRFPEFFPFKMHWWHKLIGLNKTMLEANKVVAVSNNTKNDLIDLLKVPADKVAKIYEGVGEEFKILDKNNPRLLEVRNKYNLPDKFIFYLGTLEPRKNIETIVEAYNQMSLDYDLVIAGGRGWKIEKIYQLAKNNKKIKFINYVDEADKAVLYNLASLFVYPSYYEGFGLPLIEAMACGCPVIAGANSSQFEVVGEAGILVDPYNINDIKQAVGLILSDINLRNRFIELGIKKAQEFSWIQSAKQLLEIFTKEKRETF